MIAADPAIVAQTRFGFGASATGLAAARSNPGTFVHRQIDASTADHSGLPSTPELSRQLRQLQMAVDAARKAQPAAAQPALPGAPARPSLPAQDEINQFRRSATFAELNWRVEQATTSDTPLIERLVTFWSDHFCISMAKGEEVAITAGAYEREAIRPFVLGRFRDMLGAVMHHPAMLDYLDNIRSIGPASKAGQKGKLGLNENLGREMMELHTLGVDGGYSQSDVTEAARIITGWGIRDRKEPDGGGFEFNPNRHEPGVFTVLGRQYAEAGEAQGEALLDTLATHPATARHLGAKLARYFVGERAPASLINALALAYQNSRGDLKAMTTALVTAHEAWQAPPSVVLPPYDMVIAVYRLTGHPFDTRWLDGFCNLMGEPVWRPRQPNGLPTADMAWAAPNALVKRFDWAMNFARQIHDTDPVQLAMATYGETLSPDVRNALGRAASRPEALALLMLSPQVQMR